MFNVTRIMIGIQARSTSKRFPRKIHELLDGKPVLQHVIDSAKSAALYINAHANKTNQICTVAVLSPKGDELVKNYANKILVVEGPEDDVLKRYRLAADHVKADYIVRITSDCPLVPDHLIHGIIKKAIKNEYHYFSNVDEECRTAIDGYDVEVFTKEALVWADDNATHPAHREHVTLIFRSNQMPDEFKNKTGVMVGYLDLSHIHLSLNTKEDFDRIEEEYFRRKKKIDNGFRKFGKGNVHRY